MQPNKVQRIIKKYTGLVAIAITFFLFLILNLIATPLINSGDDTFFMYTLGGGYGEAPTNLLHYNYGWHFFLGSAVKFLFTAFPGTNWYSVTLLFFHITGCSCVLYVLLKRLKAGTALLLFSLLFFFIEIRLLLSLTFTGASFVAAAGSACLLIYQLKQNRKWALSTFFALFFLVLAGMLRLQIVWLVVFLFSAVAVTMLTRKQLFGWLACVGIVIVLLFGFNKIHEGYYKKNIAGWEQQEKFRQALFYAYNRQLSPSSVFQDSVEEQLFYAGFLYDSVKFNTVRITEITRQITRKRSLLRKEDRQGLYWFFVEMRIYIVLVGVIIFLLLTQKRYQPIRKWLFALLAFFVIHAYLFVFLKITMPIHLGLLFFLVVSLCMHLEKRDSIFTEASKNILIPAAIFLVSLYCWMGIRVWKENEENKKKYQQFLCMVGELNKHRDSLFVATDDAFLLHYFYIWNTPKQFPARNLLYKDRLITHTYLQTLSRFGITNLDSALLYNKNVFLVGGVLPALEKKEKAVKLSAPDPQYNCLQVRRLIFQ